MNKIKLIEKQIKELEEEKKKLENKDKDEKIKIGLDAFGIKFIEFKQKHYSVNNKKLQQEAEEFVEELEKIFKEALYKQWSYFEKERKSKSLFAIIKNFLLDK